jgi:hypothetical protein
MGQEKINFAQVRELKIHNNRDLLGFHSLFSHPSVGAENGNGKTVIPVIK